MKRSTRDDLFFILGVILGAVFVILGYITNSKL